MPDSTQTRLKHAPPPVPLEPGQERTVSLSCRPVNRTWVINLYDVLRIHGHTVHLDQCTPVGGTSPAGELQRGLRESQAGPSSGPRPQQTRSGSSVRTRSWSRRPTKRTSASFPFVAMIPHSPNMSLARRRFSTSASIRAVQPEVAHCADDQDEAARAAPAATC